MRSKLNEKAGFVGWRKTPKAKREQFAALCREGKSREAIAGEMNIEIDTLREYARERGIPLPHSEYSVVRALKLPRPPKPDRPTQILWDERLVHKLRQLWADPALSASQIATRLGVSVTRNAVIGKVHRLGLAGRAQRGGRKIPQPSQAELDAAALAEETAEAERQAKIARATEMAEARRQAEAAQIAQEAEAERLRLAVVEPIAVAPVAAPGRKTKKHEPEPARRGVSLLELTANTCRFPVGELSSEDFHFCGRQIVRAGDPDPRLGGREAVKKLPYCPECCTRVYTKAHGYQPNKVSKTLWI